MTVLDSLTVPTSGFELGRILFALALLVALPGLLMVIRQASEGDRLFRRLSGVRPIGHGGADRSNPVSAIKGVLARFGERVLPDDGAERSETQLKLIQAGFPHPDAIRLYYAARVVSVVFAMVVLSVVFGWWRPSWLTEGSLWMAGPFAFALGLFLPTLYLDRRVAQRTKACFKGLPDMMDLLVACVEAGLGLDAAVLRVSEELSPRHPILAVHIKTVGLEMRAGKARKAAWKTFADRVGLDDAQALATMLRQAEEMGTSLGETLRIHSRDMRTRRMMKAEEQAMALSAKLTLPLIVFVFPVLLGVLILPAVLRLQDVF